MSLGPATEDRTTNSSTMPGVATCDSTPVDSWYTGWLSGGLTRINAAGGLTQFRVAFATGTNTNNAANHVKFFSGNAAAANRPVLVVYYYLPSSIPERSDRGRRGRPRPPSSRGSRRGLTRRILS